MRSTAIGLGRWFTLVTLQNLNLIDITDSDMRLEIVFFHRGSVVLKEVNRNPFRFSFHPNDLALQKDGGITAKLRGELRSDGIRYGNREAPLIAIVTFRIKKKSLISPTSAADLQPKHTSNRMVSGSNHRGARFNIA